MDEIVVAVDGSSLSLEKGVQVGKLLSDQSGKPLRLYSVVGMASEVNGRQRSLERDIQRISDEIGLVTVPAIEVVVSGEAAKPLTAWVEAHRQSLLCMTTRGRGKVAEAVLGSVATALVRIAPRPVVLVGPEFASRGEKIERLMVCLDGSPLSEAILPFAAEWGRSFALEVRLLQVLPVASTPYALGGDVSESGYLHWQAQRLESEYGVEANWDVLHDREPARAIVDYCRNRPGSMALMTTHGRTGLARLTMGSVVHEVIREAPFAVGVYRPDS